MIQANSHTSTDLLTEDLRKIMLYIFMEGLFIKALTAAKPAVRERQFMRIPYIWMVERYMIRLSVAG